MPPSFATNPLSNLLRPASRPEDPASDSRPRSPLTHLPRPKLPAVRLPRAPTVPSLSLKRPSIYPVFPFMAAPQVAQIQPAPYSPPLRPTELLVLAHGLQGTVEDFNYLIEQLREIPAAKTGTLLVHGSRVNTDKTHDGVVLGGLRLSEDIRRLVEEYPSLNSISLMGFSLGGLYVRYAAGHLYDPESDTIAGLQARKILIVASPNLGVRAFGVYRFLPAPLLQVANVLLGDTGPQLLLRDEERLLLGMTTDRNKQGTPFISALKAFSERWLYANVRNDFMVNYGTAALDHTVRVMDADADAVVKEVGGDARAVAVEQRVDDKHDEKGCRICFQLRYDSEAESDEGEGEEEEGVEREGAENKSGGEEDEVVMSRRLKKVGWSVVAVDFPSTMPIAHNRIVAMSRNQIHTWMNAGGKRVVHHLVDTFAAGFDGHEERFKHVKSRTGGGGGRSGDGLKGLLRS